MRVVVSVLYQDWIRDFYFLRDYRLACYCGVRDGCCFATPLHTALPIVVLIMQICCI